MSDPRRWFDDADLSPDERRVLEAGLAAAPPRDAKKSVLAAVLAGLPNGGGPGPDGSAAPDGTGLPMGPGAPGAAGAGAASVGAAGAGAAGAGAASAGALAFVKPAVIGFALGMTTMAGWVALDPPASPQSAAPATTAHVEAPRAPIPTNQVPSERPTPTESDASVEPASEPFNAPRAEIPTPSDPVSPDLPQVPSVRAFPDSEGRGAGESAETSESRRVAEARAQLRNGNPRAALAALDRLRVDFPRGVLVQEREALAIEALLAAGERNAARARAEDFLARYPTSPHATAARRALK